MRPNSRLWSHMCLGRATKKRSSPNLAGFTLSGLLFVTIWRDAGLRSNFRTLTILLIVTGETWCTIVPTCVISLPGENGPATQLLVLALRLCM